jgi:DNA-binding winged helix-turn-helix (wHTH) protein/Tol biopolymer transport system component
VAAPLLRFADFELDLGRFELRRDGSRLKLEIIPLELLILLVERDGQLVSREEIVERLWGRNVFLDTEHGINTAVRKIRQALRDDPDHPVFVQTVTGKGYRFVAPVTGIHQSPGNGTGTLETPRFTHNVSHAALPSAEEADAVEISSPPTVTSSAKRVFRPIVVSIIIVGLLSAAWLLRTPLPPPRITRTVQLTSGGLDKHLSFIVTDGLRVYFSEVVGDRLRLAAVPVSGGEVSLISTPFQDTQVYGVSPDKSQLLVGEGGVFEEKPLWLLPVMGGSPRRLGNVLTRGASLSPDGQQLAYVNGNDVYLAKADGSEPHKLPLVNLDSAIWPWIPVWSPDGNRLRFDRYTMNKHTCALWEFNKKDQSIHSVFPISETSPQRSAGVWTPDQKYYVFQSWADLTAVPNLAPVADIWAIREESSWIHKANREPVQLTVGPIHFWGLTPSSDGNAIFVIGSGQPRGELTRYDTKTKKFSPYLSGISGDGVSFSRDGAWIAYVTYPQGELWRSKADGSEALQLTFPPLISYGPQWSPDGKRIAFCGQKAGTLWQPYIVAADGSSQPLRPEAANGTDPSWSADGNSLLLGPVQMSPSPKLQILDLNTHHLSVLPGSEGLWSPRWSSDGRYISAISTSGDKMMLFDRNTQKWKLHAKTDTGLQRWSRDGKYIYLASVGPDPGIFRVATTGNRLEKIANLKHFRPTGQTWFSLSPNDEPLLLRDISTGSEIYALKWDAP